MTEKTSFPTTGLAPNNFGYTTIHKTPMELLTSLRSIHPEWSLAECHPH